MQTIADIEKRIERPGIFGEMAGELRRAFGERFCGLVVYGSAARGDDRRDSDIDIMAVLDEPFSRRADGAEITRILYPFQHGLDRELSVIPVRPRSLESGDDPLYRNARHEGLWLR